MHAESVTPPALPPARPLPNSRDSVSTTVQLCGADFARRTCFCAGVVNHVRPSPRPNHAGRGDLNRPVLRSTMSFPPADAMIDITEVVLLSVRQERRSEYADSLNFSSISSAFSHIAFLSRLRAGRQPAARPQDSYILNGCRSYYSMLGKRRAATNTTPLVDSVGPSL